jgi:hypothetical protein
MKFSKELIDYVADGDRHARLAAVEYSTSIREVVTVGYMIDNPQD